MPAFQVVIGPKICIMYIPKRQPIIGHPLLPKQGNTRINMQYRKESGGQQHFNFSSCFFILTISRSQSQLADFPMYRLEEVQITALYPRILKVALNRRAAVLLIKAWNINPYVPMSLSVHKQ
ncbi:hypothetical protein T4C_11982 [Trichinella pseudospiralis]|uniref:Uncharacterized protein n=1 Tax=Trichinella pseudospiralis TaxID=6337 RepID=A0A0V1K150_TRIPS|nr:hypothetical protein T4C_11982 [Trichinella pseudospiralis]